jgi:hypothetical protein
MDTVNTEKPSNKFANFKLLSLSKFHKSNGGL